MWVKDVMPDLSAIPNGAWTKKASERWVSSLPEVGKPPEDAWNASTEESLAFQKRKNEWDKQYGALQELANHHNCDLIPVQ